MLFTQPGTKAERLQPIHTHAIRCGPDMKHRGSSSRPKRCVRGAAFFLTAALRYCADVAQEAYALVQLARIGIERRAGQR